MSTRVPGPDPVVETEPTDEAVTVVQMSEPVTDTEAAYGAERVAELPVVTRYNFDRAARTWVSSDGVTYKTAGRIDLTSEGFRVTLYRGATNDDLGWLVKIVNAAKGGRLVRHGWHRVADGHLQFTYGRPISDERARADFIVPCVQPGCAQLGRHHLTDSLDDPSYGHEAPRPGSGEYDVQIMLWANESPRWRVFVLGVDEALSPDAAAVFASDLQWAAADCRKLNAGLL